MEELSAGERKLRKVEAKLQKRKRIEQSGGVRTRSVPTNNCNSATAAASVSTRILPSSHTKDRVNIPKIRIKATDNPSMDHHRFGRVMEHVPCRNLPRFSTVSVAIPGSIISNCQTRELKTIMCGQIARAVTIYHVDEIIVYDDKLSQSNRSRERYTSFRPRENDKHRRVDDSEISKTNDLQEKSKEFEIENNKGQQRQSNANSNPQVFMARILQYCECPQYLRKHFFPIHMDLQCTGLLAPIDAPHHVRADDRCAYREGVVLEKRPPNSTGSLVNCGIRNRPVQ
jgi:Putative RNA methyltransferase